MLDLKIVGATIVDGTGAPAFAGDIGVKDGRIVALGAVSDDARQTIDAKGLVVSPGFIDPHTHYDAQAFWDPTLSPSCYHGVTTIFGGHCGFSVAPLSPKSAGYLMPMLARVEGMPIESLAAGVPWDWSSFADYLDRLDGKLAINAGFLAGHSAIRRYVMDERAVGEQATPEELEAMKALLRDCIRGGALGFSTTVAATHNDADGNPVPSRHATRQEITELASVVSEFEGAWVEMLPATSFSDDTCELLAETSLAAKRPVNWNLLILRGLSERERRGVAKQLAASDYARERGGEVIALTLPQSPTARINFEAGFMFDAIPGWAELFKQPIPERIRRLRDPETRAALKSAETERLGGLSMMVDWGAYTVAEVFSERNKSHEGRTLGDIAAETGREPFDLLLDIALDDDLKTQFNPYMGVADSEELYRERAKLWLDDRTLVGGSDAGAHLDMIDTFAAPTALLELGVRKYGVISLEQAIHQLTLRPGQVMGVRDRGKLAEGWFADMVIFDPARIGQGKVHMRHDLPAGCGRLYAEALGVEHVIVNGVEIIRHGQYLGQPAGVILKSGRDTYTVGIPGAPAEAEAEAVPAE